MESILKWVLIGIAATVLVVGLVSLGKQPLDQSRVDAEKANNVSLEAEKSGSALWSPQAEALIDGFPERKGDLEALRKMMIEKRLMSVAFLGNDLTVATAGGEPFGKENTDDYKRLITLLGNANVASVFNVSGMVVATAESPETTPDRSETVSYYFNQPVPAKHCSPQFRAIDCGVCDAVVDDQWSIRYQWTSGAFHQEFAEDFAKVFQDKEFELGMKEVLSKHVESENACIQQGLEEMGYENWQDF